jgi:hypothetical protein
VDALGIPPFEASKRRLQGRSERFEHAKAGIFGALIRFCGELTCTLHVASQEPDVTREKRHAHMHRPATLRKRCHLVEHAFCSWQIAGQYCIDAKVTH